MPWRWSNPDARPISEYLYHYHLARKTYRFLYYCRECVRNFDTPERVGKCPRCGQESVIELPKDVQLERRRGVKPYGKDALKANILIPDKALASVFSRLQRSFWRIKIAMYYFLMPELDELR